MSQSPVFPLCGAVAQGLIHDFRLKSQEKFEKDRFVDEKARNGQTKAASIDKALRSLFEARAAQPAPAHLASFGEDMEGRARGAKRGRQPVRA